MGRVGNVSRDVSGKTPGSRVRAARVSKKDPSDKPTRRRVSTHTVAGASTRTLKAAPAKAAQTESVWEALGFSPTEAVVLGIKAEMMREIESVIDEAGWTQAEAAKRCKISQPRLNDLLRGKITKFSMDALFSIAFRLGRRITLHMEAA